MQHKSKDFYQKGLFLDKGKREIKEKRQGRKRKQEKEKRWGEKEKWKGNEERKRNEKELFQFLFPLLVEFLSGENVCNFISNINQILKNQKFKNAGLHNPKTDS